MSRKHFAFVAASCLVARLAAASCEPVEPSVWTTYSSADEVSYKFWQNDDCVVEVGDTVRFVLETRTGSRSRSRGSGYARWAVSSVDGVTGLGPSSVNAGGWPNINSGWPRFTREYQKAAAFTAVAPGTYLVTAQADFPYATYTPYANKNAYLSRSYTVVVRNPVADELVGRRFVSRDIAWVSPAGADDAMVEGLWIDVREANEDGTRLTLAIGIAETCALTEPECTDGVVDYTCANEVEIRDVALDIDGHMIGSAAQTDVFANGTWLSFETLELEADFAAGQLENVTVSGVADTRAIDGWIGMDTCTYLGAWGDVCQACSDGQFECASFEIDAGQAGSSALVIDPDKDASALAECYP